MTEKEVPATELMTMHRKGDIVITHLGAENAYWTDPWTKEEFFSKLLPNSEEIELAEGEHLINKLIGKGLVK